LITAIYTLIFIIHILDLILRIPNILKKNQELKSQFVLLIRSP